MNYKLDKRKLLKVINELVSDVLGMTRQESTGGYVRGTGATIGKIGNFYISIDVAEFDSDDIAIFSEVITEGTQNE